MFDEARSLLTTEQTRMFLDNWEAMVTATGAVPDWNQVDPARISAILPDVWLYEQLDDGADYLCRLAGDEIIQKWGRKMMHRRFTEIVDPAVSGRMIGHLNTVIERHGIGVGLTPKPAEPGWYAERIYGPVRRGDAWCTFGCSVYVVQRGIEEFQADLPVNRFYLFDAVDGTPMSEERY